MGFATLVFVAFHLFPSGSRSTADDDPEKGRTPRTDDTEDPEDEAEVDDTTVDVEGEGDGGDEGSAPQHPDLQGRAVLVDKMPQSVPFSRTSTTDTAFSTSSASVYSKAKEFFFPPKDPAALESFIPHYRWTPILSGVMIPFSILLEIPGLTEHWYIRTENNEIVETRSNPPLLNAGLAISITCALLANICLVMRFLEKRVTVVTLLTITFLTIHDVINVIAVAIFGVEHRFSDGFTFGQAYWTTVCSTIVSSITNVTLILDFVFTPNFSKSGSGLTRKQRSLMIIVIVLFLYLAFGALCYCFMQDLSFINALYFTTVTIETIGFGDIHPENTGSRVFTCFYIVFGILNIGVAVGMCRETVLEGLEIGYRKRLRHMRMRRREARRFREWEVRWRKAVEWRLKESKLPVWVHDRHYEQEGVRFVGLSGLHEGPRETHWFRKCLESVKILKAREEVQRHIHGNPKNKHLNIDALSPELLEAAALEAGVPLEMFINPGGQSNPDDHSHSAERLGCPRPDGRTQGTASSKSWPKQPQTPTHAQIGRMAAMVTTFAVAGMGTPMDMMGHLAGGSQLPLDNRGARANAGKPVDSADEISSPGPKKGSSVWFDAGESGEKKVSSSKGETADGARSGPEPSNLHCDNEGDCGLVDVGMHAPQWARDMAHRAQERSTFTESYEHFKEEMATEERKAYYAKLTVAWTLFLLFWFVGSAIFSATEGWTYGIAMYFCFMAFTTTGYGDYAPVTPAGRSIFVFWALLGVATMTILISVVQEAGSTRYKSVIHSRVFDSAVKRYRKRESEETNRVVHERLTPYLRNCFSKSQTASQEDITPGMVDAVREMTQRGLESLPGEIIKQARIFREHMQYYASHERGDGGPDATAGRGGNHKPKMPRELLALLDDIASAEGIGSRGKREILQDEESRKTLFVLSIGRTLRQMVNTAEKSLAAIAERDNLMALQCHREHDQTQGGEQAARRFEADVIIGDESRPLEPNELVDGNHPEPSYAEDDHVTISHS